MARPRGAWRRTYVISAVISLYLNVFVLIAQLFMKVPALKALAPRNQSRRFCDAGRRHVVFIVLGFLAGRRFPAEASCSLSANRLHERLLYLVGRVASICSKLGEAERVKLDSNGSLTAGGEDEHAFKIQYWIGGVFSLV